MSRNFREMEEDVYDSGVMEPDDKCSLFEDGYWYENDLLLAAELGKTLLERNRDLETQVGHLQKSNHEYQAENKLLSKQLTTLRDLNRNKMKLYEEVDRHNTDLELLNQRLETDASHDKQKIHSLLRANSLLEAQAEELKERLSALETEKDEWLRCRQMKSSDDSSVNSLCGGGGGSLRRLYRRSNSLPTVTLGCLASGSRFPLSTLKVAERYGDHFDEAGSSQWQASTQQLRLRLAELSCQLRDEQERSGDFETDLRATYQVNQELTRRLAASERRSELWERDCAAMATQEMHHQGTRDKSGCSTPTNRGTPPHTTTPSPPNSRSSPAPPSDPIQADLFSSVEHDLPSLVGRGSGKLGSLRTGGQVYSSQESLNRVGASPAKTPPPGQNVSLLAELDQQYNKLVSEYEALVSAKRPAAGFSECGSGRNSPYNSTGSEFESRLGHIFSEETRRERKTMITQDYRPKYKQLFRDAFGLLQEMKQQTTPPSVPGGTRGEGVSRPRGRPTARQGSASTTGSTSGSPAPSSNPVLGSKRVRAAAAAVALNNKGGPA